MDDTPYDLVEYPGRAFLQCHPDRLATVGRLFGATPAPLHRSRVLELGCGEGVNVMGAAVTLPETEFVGIDLSRAAIERGRANASESGLQNVRLEHLDLCMAGDQFGSFDYIIAHGLYSWVPEAVRDALLGLVKRVMNPAGIAFISYNAYPGWYMRQMVREMITSLDGIKPASEWLEVLRQHAAGSATFNFVVADEANEMQRRHVSHFFHDDLAAVNCPVYFRAFVQHAAGHGLQYLAEAELGATGMTGLKPDAAEAVARFAGTDRIEREQYADFLRGRRFRQTLLCHAGLPVRQKPDASATRDLYTGAPTTRHDPDSQGRTEYVSLLGGRVTTSDASLRALLDRAAFAWPSFIPVTDTEISEESILDLYANNVIDLRTVPPPVAQRVTSRPRASGLARVRAQQGLSVTSLHHIEVTLTNTSMRSLLTLLDGTRTRAELIRDLAAIYPSAPKDTVSLAVDTHLTDLLRNGLLMDQLERP